MHAENKREFNDKVIIYNGIVSLKLTKLNWICFKLYFEVINGNNLTTNKSLICTASPKQQLWSAVIPEHKLLVQNANTVCKTHSTVTVRVHKRPLLNWHQTVCLIVTSSLRSVLPLNWLDLCLLKLASKYTQVISPPEIYWFNFENPSAFQGSSF